MFSGFRVARIFAVALVCLGLLAGTAARADRIELVSHALPELVSDTAGAASSLFTGQQSRPMVSSDGRWSVFLSSAPNLVAGQVDFNNGDDVFLYDRQNDAVTLVSRADGAPAKAGNRASGSPSISSDGRWIAFFSHAGDLIPGQIESNPGEDVFVYDRDTGVMTLVSHIATSSVTTGNHFSFDPVISANGNAVTFVSRAGNLMTGQADTSLNEDIFYWDRATNTTTLVTHIATSTTSAPSGALSSVPVISADGAYVAYTTGATNLMSGGTDTNGRIDVYFWVRASNANFIVSHNTTQVATGNGSASSARISADGAFILFSSGGTNHVSGQSDSNGSNDLFLYIRSLGIISLVSRSNSSSTITGNGATGDGVISADGNWVAFVSRGTNLVSGQIDGNVTDDVFLWNRATGVTTLVTRRAGTTATTSASPSIGGAAVSISADGSAVGYYSRATELISGQSDTNGVADAFVFDRATGTNVLASGAAGSASATGNSAATGVSLSGNGQWLAYSTSATNVLSPQVDTNGGDDVLLFGRAAAANSLVSRRDPSLPSDSIGGDSSVVNSNAANPVPNAVVSADGRYTVFQSTAGRLVPGQVDVNGVADVFLYDRTTGETQLVSRADGTTLTAGNGESRVPVISADGRWVAFVSRATNLAPSQNDGNAADDVFLWDRVTGSMALVSHSSSGLIFAGTGSTPALSADGSYVAFLSTATNIVPGQSDGNISNEVFLYERATGTTTLVTHSRFSTTSAQGSNGDPWISADGRYVAFVSSGSSFIPSQNDPSTSPDVFLWDRTTDTFALVSHTAVSPLNAAGGFFGHFTMSADGNWIAFSSSATNLVTGVTDTNSQPDIFLWERATNTNRLVSRAAGVATTANNASQGGMLSADGSRLAFLSRATNLVSGGTDTNSGLDAFFYDRATGQVRLMSHTTASQVAAGNGVSRVVAISADGSRISFQSAASNLVPLDTFGSYDILLYDPATGAVSLASYQQATSSGLIDNCDNGFLSADGKVVAFSTSDRNVVANDFNARQDVFLWINESGTDLVLGKTDGVGSLVPGQPVTYLITATNAGPLAVSGATVTDNFPAALQGVTWTCAAAGGASCTAASGAGALSQSVNLPVNGTVTFAVTGTVAADATGTLANTASIAPPGAVPDLNPANNSATDTDALTPQADLAVSMTDSPDPVGRGATLTWLVSVTNAGPSTAASVTVTDTLPAGATFAGASGDGWSCGHAGGVVTCTRPSLAPGSAPALSIQATAPVARGIATLTNNVMVVAATADPVANNAAGTETSVPQPGITVAPVSGLTTTEAGGTATFTVVLDSAPLADVAIPLTSSETAEGSVSPATLVFTPGDWSTPQTVTITGVNDDYDDGDAAFTVTTGAASSTDVGYAGIDPADVAATNQDDDTAGFTVTPVSGLITTEAGGTATFTIAPTSRPRADVTIALASSDTAEGTVSPASLTFTTDDWSTPKTVTVTGVNDDYDDGDVAFTVTTGAAASTDAGYAGIDPADVAVTNQDDDTAGFTVTPVDGLTTTEAGGTATFTIVPNARPRADVTVALESDDTDEGTVEPASLTFTASDWSTPKTVTVTGVDDAYDDGTVSYTITTGAAESTDAAWAGLDPADVAVSNQDDDTAGITVAPVEGLLTTEQGGTAIFTVSLVARPAQDVTIALESSDAGEGLPSPTSLTFTPDDWETPQTVTVTGQNDDLRDGNVAYTIVVHPAQSGDAAFAGIDPTDVSAINQDDSYEGVFYTVTPCRLVDTNEPGYGPALQNNQVAVVEVFGACGVPPTARAVAMNLTFSAAGQRGQVLVFPGDLTQPPVAEYLWIEAGRFARSLATIMPLGADGTLAILPQLKAPRLNPTVHVALDVTGYFE